MRERSPNVGQSCVTPAGYCGIAIVAMLLALPAHAESRLMLGYVEFPPFFYTDARGEPRGEIIDMARKVAELAGYELSAASFPPKRLEKNLVEGRIDLWIGLDTFARMKANTLSSKTVVSTIELRAYHEADMAPIGDLKQLSGMRVGVYHGYSYGGWMSRIQDPASGIEPVVVRMRPNAAKMLESDRIDYLLDYRGPFESQVHPNVARNLEYEPLATYNLRFVVSKKHPQAYQLMSKLEGAWHKLRREGRL
ncbi:substrate-binding periplasmic protein [Aestuariirhabdus sp. LZHN29]|uniref:substrate-binding periplasmic protein n=1 Tax=Aestuariirhabdus sp. LZHN29 TaxID=3417462 RepID=UPI003CF70340